MSAADGWVRCKACPQGRDLFGNWTTYTCQEMEAVGVMLSLGAATLLPPLPAGRPGRRWVLGRGGRHQQGGQGQVRQAPLQAGHLSPTGSQVSPQLRHQQGLVVQRGRAPGAALHGGVEV